MYVLNAELRSLAFTGWIFMSNTAHLGVVIMSKHTVGLRVEGNRGVAAVWLGDGLLRRTYENHDYG